MEWFKYGERYHYKCKIKQFHNHSITQSFFSQNFCSKVKHYNFYTLHNGSCVSANINGECDIENRNCIAGDYEYLGAGYSIVRWKCKGIGNGSTAECEYFVNCASRGLGYNGCTLNDAGFKDGKCVYEIDYGYGYPCWATECCQGYSHSVYVGGKQYTIWENYVGNG